MPIHEMGLATRSAPHFSFFTPSPRRGLIWLVSVLDTVVYMPKTESVTSGPSPQKPALGFCSFRHRSPKL